ncbi:MAG: signal peptidase I [Oscillospiraceae bacterium]|nr:signal peptidase I [Oscillospiraceae bacterium]
MFIKKKEKDQAPKEKLNWKQNLMLNLHDVIYVLAGFMVIYMLFFRVVVVVGPSMYDTLLDGDRLVLVSNAIYQEPKQGDIVVISKDSFKGGECIVKRVIATEGQTVRIESGRVYVDDVEMKEPYTNQPFSTTLDGRDMKFPLTVQEGQVFVLGDNRYHSMDSRNSAIGLIDERQILGKAVFLLSPGTHGGTEKADYDRIGVLD